MSRYLEPHDYFKSPGEFRIWCSSEDGKFWELKQIEKAVHIYPTDAFIFYKLLKPAFMRPVLCFSERVEKFRTQLLHSRSHIFSFLSPAVYQFPSASDGLLNLYYAEPTPIQVITWFQQTFGRFMASRLLCRAQFELRFS